ncbi:MAG: hypothetical protein JST75_20815 [Bacteroidetes bacterium]|nr:hypothetical protein [Bacteroidota bacterium]
MEQNKQYLLIDHLDNLLTGEALAEVEGLIRDDQEMAKESQYLKLSVEAIQESALYDQVSAIRKQFSTLQQTDAKPQGAVVRSMSKYVLRIAATVLILIGAAVAYKYTTVSATSMYNEYYTSFDLNTTRGSEKTNDIERAYRDKNWESVISLANKSTEKTNKTYFLTGMANLELKKYSNAIKSFNHIIGENAKTGDNYFQDEAEYYMALALLANNDAAKALPLLAKIKADKNHTYHEKVKSMSSLDLNILQYKSSK